MPFTRPTWLGQDKEAKRKKQFRKFAVLVSKSQGDISAALIALTTESEEDAAGPSNAANESSAWMPVSVCKV